MEPRIQYTKTNDGVNIAYATYGAGSALVWIMNPVGSHVQLEWQLPLYKAAIGLLSASRTLIRFDQRGVGLSDREVQDVSLDARVRDLSAVVDCLKLDKFDLLGLESGGHTAIAYAAKHPESISRLLLLNCYPRGADASQTARAQALAGLQGDWELLTDTVGANSLGLAQEDAHRYGAFLRACVTQEMWTRLGEADAEIDVSELLPLVRSPTLIVRHSGIKWLSMDATRELAAALPNARLVVIEGLYPDNTRDLFRAINDFLGLGEQTHASDARSSPRAPTGTAVILFADIADSTALTERLGDTAFRDKARELDGALRTVIREHSGTPIEGKLLGDGVLAVFTSARQAIEAAIACARCGDDAGLPLHLGLHAGDVIREDNNVFGGAVNIASRIAGLSAAGEVLVSETVRSLARTSAGVRFEDRGEQVLKGVGEAVRVWVVREGGE